MKTAKPKPEDFGASCDFCHSNCGQCGTISKWDAYQDALNEWERQNNLPPTQRTVSLSMKTLVKNLLGEQDRKKPSRGLPSRIEKKSMMSMLRFVWNSKAKGVVREGN
jgi:hypothetical protein